MGRRLAAGAILAACLALGAAVHGRQVRARLLRTNPDAVLADAGLATRAVTGGAQVFAQHCAACHGAGGHGDPSRGVPDLTDDDWLYGQGRVSEIMRVVSYGIRSHDTRGWNLAVMPAYAQAVPSAAEPRIQPLSPADIDDMTAYLFRLEGRTADMKAAARGSAVFGGRGGCYDCHGPDAKGDPSVGAPNLTDRIWLNGDGGAADIHDILTHGRQGVCPAWSGRLTAEDILAVSVYVHTLSQPAPAPRT